MIINTWCTEEVNGIVIGSYMLIGTLRYEGRQQEKTFYGESESELLVKAKNLLRQIKTECGDAFAFIYPLDAWEMRIHYSD